ncbi:hypothetical protein DRQ53_13970 [bacterium]|nr:MAG: hypothetical protein DRQ53_13970 [bacterium]RKZ13451.1 MAG: hypothetical protein DRQ32_01540 [bacterium]
MEQTPLITNDAVVLGILMVILAFVFRTSHSDNPRWKKFYGVVPSLLLCYFIPSLFSTFGIISGEHSNLYFVASRYLLPTSLVLLTISIDLPGVMRLGPKAITMFFTGTVGIVIGGPLAIWLVALFSPETVGMGTDDVWRGLTTIAGSWIGGGANQTAMKEVFEVSDEVFSALVAVDVIVANIWMAGLLWAAGRAKEIDARTGADASAIDHVRQKVAEYRASIIKIPTLTDTMTVLAVGFAVTAIAHAGADFLAPFLLENAPQLQRFSLTSHFFWLIVIATTLGMILSSRSEVRRLEGVGASRLGSAFLYVLVATIGMKMDLTAIFRQPGLFVVGAVWISIHAILLIVMMRIIKAPVFFLAVGSQANVGGAASAPIVASAFHPALAPVGVLLAVLGYAVGTYAAWFCGILMQFATRG